MNSDEKAKRIFRSYNGSHFHMEREGEYRVYKRYGISRDTERKWLRELQEEIFLALNQTSNLRAKADLLSQYGDVAVQLKDVKAYQFMVEYLKDNKEQFDSNTILRNVNTILNTIQNCDERTKAPIAKECLDVLNELIKKPIKISDDYKEDGKLPDYLSEERVFENIKNAIRYGHMFNG